MSSPNRRYTNATVALLWSRSGGLCCFPDCGVECVEEASNLDPAVIVGQIGHIEAHSDIGPRANPSLSPEERNSYPNLILYCPNHHTLVDRQPNTFAVEEIIGWKLAREVSRLEYIAQEMGSVTFAELETVTQALVNSSTSNVDSIAVIPLGQKMDRNELTDQTERLVNIGLLQVKHVQDFVESMSSLDSQFTNRLISGFVNEYQIQRQAGLEGDALFEGMQLFSSQGRSDLRHQAAGLAVLVYLFERCEVFEH